MTWERFARFQVIGHVERKFVVPSGKCAFLTLSVPGKNNKDQKLEFVTFDHVEDVGALGTGQTVQIKGTIGSTALKNKEKQDVQVNGRTFWYPQLVITKVDVQGGGEKAAAPKSTAWEDEKPAPRGMSVEEQSEHDKVDW